MRWGESYESIKNELEDSRATKESPKATRPIRFCASA
jgi:hypothetical protein